MNRRRAALFAFLAIPLLAAPALATLPSGVTGAVTARGTVGEQVKLREPDESDFVMQSITIQPGGQTGWHTHPGAALAIVSSGTLTLTSVREGARGHGLECVTETISAGRSFVDPGHGNVHVARNLGSEPVEVRVTYTGVPTGGAFRLDAVDPGC
jgi:hypothetical protein